LSDEEDSANAAIWQAGRATSAAPTFFPAISFGNPSAQYVDGAMVHNNPIRVLMREVLKIWGPDAAFSCVVSIGTGQPPPRKLGAMGHQLLLACAKLATGAEKEARSFKADRGGILQKEGKYFRFNVTRGLQDVKLEEWQAFDLMDAATKTYLEEIDDEIQACSERVRNPITSNTPSGFASHHHSSPAAYQGKGIETTLLPQNNIKPEYVDITRVSSRFFTGRDNILASMHDYYNDPHTLRPRIAVMTGLGGVGKTQIALRYFEREKPSYSVALFVGCDSEQEAIGAFMRFAHLVVDEELRQFPETSFNEAVKKLGFTGLIDEQAKASMAEVQMRIVNAVKAWLGRQQERFLLIFDNADDPVGVHLGDLIPHHNNGDIIITTRDTDTKAFGHLFSIEELAPEEATDLLARATNTSLDTPEKRRIAGDIARELGYLPLAIDQASGYLTESDTDMIAFLPAYELHAKSLLSKIPNDGMLGYKHSAFTTWEMSFERLQTISSYAPSLLQLLGFVHNHDICELLYHPKGAVNSPTKHDGFLINEAIGFLSKLCLIRRNGQTRAFDIHPVVHVWIKERLNATERSHFSREAVKFVAEALPSLHNATSGNSWAVHRRLFPHIQSSWRNVMKYVPSDDDSLHGNFLVALDSIASSFRLQGHYQIAEEALLRVYRGNELAWGKDDPATLDSASNLASVYELLGSLTKSEELYRQAAEGLANSLGADHRKTLAVLHKLANVLKYMGKSSEAERLYNEVLESRKKKLGEVDPDTLETMDALASLYYDSRRASDAEPLRLLVLKTREKSLGMGDPKTLTTRLNMGILYSGLGKNELALEMLVYGKLLCITPTDARCRFNKAYDGRTSLLRTPTAENFNALTLIAAFYANMGHAMKAELMFRELLSGQQSVLGNLHPDTLWTQNCLGGVLFMKEKSVESVHLVERAFFDIETILGPDHLDTLWVAHNLAMVYESTGRLADSEPLQERVVRGYVADLGADHINTLYMINDLGECYMRGGKYEKAEENFRKAYEGKKKLFGARSPHTFYTAIFLAATMKEKGDEEAAEASFKETLSIAIETLGTEHADVCLCMMYLSDLYVSQRRFQQARDLYQKVYNTRTKLQGADHKNTRHVSLLLAEMDSYLESPGKEPQTTTLARQANIVPSQFGFRARNDTVQVLF
jgi:tetratricopeptide (TPR) repeat protein